MKLRSIARNTIIRFLRNNIANSSPLLNGDNIHARGRTARIATFIWILALIPILFSAENIWIDSFIRHRLHRLPSLVPEALTGTWFLVFSLLLISCLLLVFCQILLIRSSAPVRTKLNTAIVVLLLLLLVTKWCWTTTGHTGLPMRFSHRKHSVLLTWKASSSPVAGYNVYRSPTCGANYRRINDVLVKGLSYTDVVEGGAAYCYVTRAVDSSGHESLDSNEISVVVP